MYSTLTHSPFSGGPLYIAMTAHVTGCDRKTFMKAGMNGYVAKPFDREEISQAIVDVLSAE